MTAVPSPNTSITPEYLKSLYDAVRAAQSGCEASTAQALDVAEAKALADPLLFPSPIQVVFSDDFLLPRIAPIVPGKEPDDPPILSRRYETAAGVVPGWEFEIYENTDRLDPSSDPVRRGCSVTFEPQNKQLVMQLTDGGKMWWTDPVTGQKIFIGGVAYTTFASCPMHSSIDLSGGKTLVIEMEWDNSDSARRWQDMMIIPHGDRIINNKWRYLVNTPSASQNALMLSCMYDRWQVVQFDKLSGRPPKIDPNGVKSYDKFMGASVDRIQMPDGSTQFLPCWRVKPPYSSMADAHFLTDLRFNGVDDDYKFHRRHKIRAEVTTKHAKVFEQGYLMLDYELPKEIDWTQVDLIWLQHLYESNHAWDEAKNSKQPRPSWFDPILKAYTPDAFVDVRTLGAIKISVVPAGAALPEMSIE